MIYKILKYINKIAFYFTLIVTFGSGLILIIDKNFFSAISTGILKVMIFGFVLTTVQTMYEAIIFRRITIRGRTAAAKKTSYSGSKALAWGIVILVIDLILIGIAVSI